MVDDTHTNEENRADMSEPHASPKVLIVSVGGSHEPILTSIRHHRPRLVIFFASMKSAEDIGAIKRALEEESVSFANENVIVPDAERLVDCYVSALSCLDRARAAGYEPADILVDFTGGTKVMSAALALASVGRGCRFSYVGGRERTKKGVGTVITGSEQLIMQGDPFEVFAIHERRSLALYFERYQFEAAQAVLAGLLDRLTTGPSHCAFKMVQQLAQGYAAWDRFQYPIALRTLKATWRSWTATVQANPSILYAEVCPALERHVTWLERLEARTKHFQRPHGDLVADMIANAERRAEEGKYDDAVVRLYRALELGAQAAIDRRLHCGTSAIPADHVPEELRADFIQRGYEVTPGVFQLPLEASYRLLHALGEPEGVRFLERYDEIKKIQAARNFSMLAHGLTPTTKEAYESLHALIGTFLPVADDLRFVRLPWPE